jgi:transposase
LGALGLDGLIAVMSVEAATSTTVFLAYLTAVLIPALRRGKPDAVVIMDHLAPHRATQVGAVLAAAGLRLLYLPRYSPDLSPIEPCWSKLKTCARLVSQLRLRHTSTVSRNPL